MWAGLWSSSVWSVFRGLDQTFFCNKRWSCCSSVNSFQTSQPDRVSEAARVPGKGRGSVGWDALCRTIPAVLLQMEFPHWDTSLIQDHSQYTNIFVHSTALLVFSSWQSIKMAAFFSFFSPSPVIQFTAFTSNFLIFCQERKTFEKGSC